MMKPINFVLSQEEVRQGLILSGVLKPAGKKGIIQAIIAGILAAVYIVDIIMNPENRINYFLLAVCIFLIPLVLILPKNTEKKIVDSHTDGAQVTVSLEEEKLLIEAQAQDLPPYAWSISGEQVERFLETEDIFLFILNDRRALIIPKRECDEEQKQQITNMAKEFIENLGE